MFLRRQGIQPDVINRMHLFDVLLEIMIAVDPTFDPNSSEDAGGSRGNNGGRRITLNQGQSLRSALSEAGLT